jgi:hypothetical protein
MSEVSAIQLASPVVAGAALAFTIWQAYLQRLTTQAQIAEALLRNIREAENELQVLRAKHNPIPSLGDLTTAAQAWSIERAAAERLFRAIDYMALLIRLRVIRQRDIIRHFKRQVPMWHEAWFVQMLPDHYADFPDFTALYRQGV